MFNNTSRKLIANQCLMFALFLYILSVFCLDYSYFFYYLKAFSEAAIVGGIADWFAVTALFKHPLGLKIPHTAIIPNSKSKIGKNLSKFIRENFLSEDYVRENIKKLNVKEKTYILLKENKLRILNSSINTILLRIENVNYKDLQIFINPIIKKKIEEIDLKPIIIKIIKNIENEKYHRFAFLTVLKSLNNWLSNPDNEKLTNEAIKNIIKKNEKGENSFSGVFKSFFFGEPKLYKYLSDFIISVEKDPEQKVLAKVDLILKDIYFEIENNSLLKYKLSKLKENIIRDLSIEEHLTDLFNDLKSWIKLDLNKEDSILKEKISNYYETLLNEFNTNTKVDKWINHQIEFKIPQFMSNNIDFIDNYFVEYIENLNTDEISKIIEDKVGEDLQFIRINGTIIGGIIGLSLFSITEIILHFIGK